jgi:hypothetical protein
LFCCSLSFLSISHIFLPVGRKRRKKQSLLQSYLKNLCC